MNGGNSIVSAQNKQMNNKNSSLKNILGIIAAAAGAFILFKLLPADQLSAQARSLCGIFLAAIVLWVTEAIPPAVVSLLVIALMPLFGVCADLKSATVGFTSSVIYFVIASFVISYAVEISGLGNRFALWLLSKTGTKSKIAVLVFMFGTATTSTIMSDVPSAAIWMSLALPILDDLKVETGKSNFGKCMMMGIPIAALTGGVATPAGSSINILALSILKDQANINISFLQWMGIGIPVYLIMTFIAWFILVKMIPPEIESIGNPEEFKSKQKNIGIWTIAERKTAVIMMIAFILWISSSWIKWMDISIVAILIAIVMFLPGIHLVKWSEAEKFIGWSTVLVIGVVTSLGMASVSTGLSQWVVQNALGGLSHLNIIWITLIIAAFTIIVHIPIPINPAIIAAILPPVILLANSTGVNPAIYAIPITFTTSAAFLLPLDSVCLVTFSKNYYSMYDMFVPGALISIVWVVLVTLLTITVGPILGF